MRVWAISDLHLSGAKPKPMDIFGKNWFAHPDKIAAAWRERVAPEDLVLCPGDISWAMTLEEVAPDLAYLEALPGRKILLRGNHDYWWKRKALGQVKKALPPSISLLQGNAFAPTPELIILGARGWRFPGERTVGDDAPAEMAKEGAVDDAKIFAREIEYLKNSVRDAQRLGLGGKYVLGMMHYPPFNWSGEESPFSRLLAEAGTKLCIYGHLHGADTRRAFQGVRGGIEYRLVSADAVDFQPVRLL
jgi:uncharacterized protein